MENNKNNDLESNNDSEPMEGRQTRCEKRETPTKRRWPIVWTCYGSVDLNDREYAWLRGYDASSREWIVAGMLKKE